MIKLRSNHSMRNLQTIFILEESMDSCVDLDMVVEAIMDGNAQSAHDHMLRLLHTELSQISSEFLPKSYIRFCGLSNSKGYDEIKTDIQNNRITLSNPFKFNDPMDPILKVWVNMQKKEQPQKTNKELFKIAKNALKNLRICCMADSRTLGDNAPLMWSHYADGHKGIAIKYKVTKEALERYNDAEHLLRLCPVRYRDHKELNHYITIDNALLAKGSCWEYESEHRLLYFSTEDGEFKPNDAEEKASPKRKDFISLDGFEIEEIYLGALIDSNKESEIKQIAKSIGVSAFKMRYDDSDITKLKADKLYL